MVVALTLFRQSGGAVFTLSHQKKKKAEVNVLVFIMAPPVAVSPLIKVKQTLLRLF